MNMFEGGSESCKFCQIVRGAIQSRIVFEDDATLVFLDHRPLFAGHCLLIPKKHYETLRDLPAAVVPVLFGNLQLLAGAVEDALAADGSFVAINNRVSQSVPHLHVHVVPRRKKDGLKGFFWPRQKYENEEAILKVQEALRSTIARIRPELADPI